MMMMVMIDNDSVFHLRLCWWWWLMYGANNNKLFTKFDPHLLVTHLSLWRSPFLKRVLNNLTIDLKQLVPHFTVQCTCTNSRHFWWLRIALTFLPTTPWNYVAPVQNTSPGDLPWTCFTLTWEFPKIFTFFCLLLWWSPGNDSSPHQLSLKMCSSM